MLFFQNHRITVTYYLIQNIYSHHTSKKNNYSIFISSQRQNIHSRQLDAHAKKEVTGISWIYQIYLLQLFVCVAVWYNVHTDVSLKW